MTARAEFDVGPLSWVKGEIDHAIQRAQEALRAFAADSADPAQLRSSEAHKHLREHRSRYQRGLLKWLKNDASGAEDMRAAIEAIEAPQGPTSQRAFWWASLAFFDALAHKALPQDLDAKQLCNRIEHQIKRLLEGTPSVAERLMREVLYYVARARPASERVREVQEAYHLSQTIPAADNDGTAAAELPALKSAREHLTHAKGAWNKFASGNPPSLLAFRDSASALKDSAGQLGNADLAALAGEVAGLAAWLTSNREKMS